MKSQKLWGDISGKLVPGANGRQLYRGKGVARPHTGLKVAGGAWGGGGRGKRINTDAAHAGRWSRISAAAGRELVALSESHGRPLQETAARAWEEEKDAMEGEDASGWESFTSRVGAKLHASVSEKLPWPFRQPTQGRKVD